MVSRGTLALLWPHQMTIPGDIKYHPWNENEVDLGEYTLNVRFAPEYKKALNDSDNDKRLASKPIYTQITMRERNVIENQYLFITTYKLWAIVLNVTWIEYIYHIFKYKITNQYHFSSLNNDTHHVQVHASLRSRYLNQKRTFYSGCVDTWCSCRFNSNNTQFRSHDVAGNLYFSLRMNDCGADVEKINIRF